MVGRYTQVLLDESVLDYGLKMRGDRPPPDPDGEPIPWFGPVALLAADRDAFERELGLVFQRTHDDGLGYVDLAVLDLPSGARVALMRYEASPPDQPMSVKLLPQQFVNGFRSAREAVATDDYLPEDRADRWAAIESALDRVQDDVLRELAEALGPHLVHVTWLRPAIDVRVPPDAPQRRWEVWRQDDAGNRHLMQDGLTEQEARAVAARYESRGHKQMYWAQRAGDDGVP